MPCRAATRRDCEIQQVADSSDGAAAGADWRYLQKLTEDMRAGAVGSMPSLDAAFLANMVAETIPVQHDREF